MEGADASRHRHRLAARDQTHMRLPDPVDTVSHPHSLDRHAVTFPVLQHHGIESVSQSVSQPECRRVGAQLCTKELLLLEQDQGVDPDQSLMRIPRHQGNTAEDLSRMDRRDYRGVGKLAADHHTFCPGQNVFWCRGTTKSKSRRRRPTDSLGVRKNRLP